MTGNALGIIGGSGLGETFAKRSGTDLVEIDTPFGPPSGPILRSRIGGMECLFLSRHGPGHVHSPSRVPYRANIFALKTLGVTQIIASGATGSLRESIAPGDLVICDQVIDKTYRREGTFFDEGLATHVEFADPFCPRLRRALLDAAGPIDVKVHESGTYVCMEGPQFSTRAESHMHRQWGGDLIGMTCMPEAKLAREAEMCYALIALPTDYDCWRPKTDAKDRHALLSEIMANMKRAGDAAGALIDVVIGRLAKAADVRCACHDALELAIWSDKSSVRPDVVKKLEPLIGRHFADKG